jgi:hypothetical protein
VRNRATAGPSHGAQVGITAALGVGAVSSGAWQAKATRLPDVAVIAARRSFMLELHALLR